MKNSLILLFSMLFLQASHAQLKEDGVPKKRPLILRGGLLHTSLYNPPFYYRTCFEGCFAEEQSGLPAETFNIGVVFPATEKSKLNVLTGYSEFRYRESGYISPGSGLSAYQSDRTWKFWGIELEHVYRFYTKRRVAFFGGNGLRFETPIPRKPDSRQVMKTINLCYNARMGAEFMLSETLSVTANALFKTSVLKYNKADAAPGHNDYHPYGFGGEIGLIVKHKKS